MIKSDATKRPYVAPNERMAILKRGLLKWVSVADLCDECATAPKLFYRWQRALFENGHAAFENDRRSKAAENARAREAHEQGNNRW